MDGTLARAVLAGLLVTVSMTVYADTFLLPGNGDSVVGGLGVVATEDADTLSDIARAYDQGYTDMRLANPTVDPWLPGADTELLIPSFYVLPDAPYDGIVVNVPEMRLYYYPKPGKDGRRYVVTHPISIGRQEWITPHGAAKVVAKAEDPAWYPPDTIRAEHAQRGDPLPRVVPPGPENPLGKFALRLSIPGYLIHGTNRPYGIGMRVTHGCIRMYPKDIARLFFDVPTGAKVNIVNQPFKVGRLGPLLYIEAHPHLREDHAVFRDQHTRVMQLIIARAGSNQVNLQWDKLNEALTGRSGVPAFIAEIRTPMSLTAFTSQ